MTGLPKAYTPLITIYNALNAYLATLREKTRRYKRGHTQPLHLFTLTILLTNLKRSGFYLATVCQYAKQQLTHLLS
jgi:hypothetical protein